jgi:hypothetical protein
MLILLEWRLRGLALSDIRLTSAGDTFPVPGGPKRSIPRAGSRRPENRSGRRKGYMTVSFSEVFASSRPANN